MQVKFFLSVILILSLAVLLHHFQQSADARSSQAIITQQLAPTAHPIPPMLDAYSAPSVAAILDEEVEAFRQKWQLKGVSLALAKDGRLVYAKGFGYANEAKKTPVKPYHLFRIASVSKLFTAVGIMKLVEAKKLKLSDKVFGKEGILSDYDSIADPLALKITVEHLLTHTAGWRNQLRRDPMFAPTAVADIMGCDSPPPFSKVIEFMLRQKGYFEPGTLYDYSNFGYALLSEIIAQVSGKSYQRYMQEEVLQPLGIRNMQFTKNRPEDCHPFEVHYYTHAKESLNVSCYTPPDSASRAYEGTDTEGLSGAGAWIASPRDLLRFVVAIDGFESKPDILSQQSIEEMTLPKMRDSTHYLLYGWKQVDEEKWWRTGSLAATNAALVRYHNGISWAFVSNTGTWRGPYFSYEIEAMMRRALARIKRYPSIDLFELEVPAL